MSTTIIKQGRVVFRSGKADLPPPPPELEYERPNSTEPTTPIVGNLFWCRGIPYRVVNHITGDLWRTIRFWTKRLDLIEEDFPEIIAAGFADAAMTESGARYLRFYDEYKFRTSTLWVTLAARRRKRKQRALEADRELELQRL